MSLLVFISYATKDANIFKISEIAKRLEGLEHIEDVLYWQEDLKDNIYQYMNDNLGRCDIMLLFCSPNALKSEPVAKEWTAADAMQKPIIPIFLKTEHIPPLLKSRLGLEYNQFDFDKLVKDLHSLILKKCSSSEERLPQKISTKGIPQKSPFKTKLVKKSEIEILKALQKELNKPLEINEFKVNEDGSVISFDFSSLVLDSVPTTISSFPNLMELNFSSKSFRTDNELKHIVFDGLVVKLNGKEYEIGQIEARIKREADEKANKELEEKIEKQKRLKLENQTILNQAQQRFNEKKWEEAIILFTQSKEICSNQQWLEEINYVEKMIQKAETNLKKEDIERVKAFRGSRMPQFKEKIEKFEADILIEIEILTNEDFIEYDTIEWDTKMGFSTENGRLTGIGLCNCGLTTLPESIKQLTSLQILYLYNNRLTTLPEFIGQLSSLKDLYLGYNELKTFPESIGNLKSLQSLWLEGNHLTTLPEYIGQLSSLQILDLGINELETLPESIGNLSSLKILLLDYNQLLTLPEPIFNLKALEKLFLESNRFKTYPASVEKLQQRGVKVYI